MTLDWCILNRTWNSAKHILVCVLAVPVLVSASFGGTWRDSFEDGVLNGWEQDIAESEGGEWRVCWKARADSLEVRVDDIRPWNPDIPRLFNHAIAFLELIAFELDGEHLVVNGLSIKGEGMTFGIAIGQRYPPSDGRLGIVYHFSSWGHILKLSFSGNGGIRGLKPPKINYVNPKKPVDIQIEHLKVLFDTGHFQLFSADNLVAEFVDPEYKTVDLVGMMILGEVPGTGSLDEFIISGPGILDGTGSVAVHFMTKLATTWGGIKNRRR